MVTPQAPVREGRIPVLRAHQLDEIVEAAVAEELVAPERRSLLLAGLPPELVHRLRTLSRPLDQLRHDIVELSRMDRWVHGRLPALAVWLQNAAGISSTTDCRHLFLSYWARVVAPGLERDPPVDVVASTRVPWAVGEVFDGRFELTELLSDGSWSQVWRGVDLRLQREVAIKVLRPEFGAHRERRARFLRGARHMAALPHPNVARVLELVGTTSSGGPCYYWMEYLSGGSLEAALVEGRVEAGSALRALLAAAEGLAAAHARGLLHRDVKPSNILLDEHGVAKLTDFDLIKTAESCGDTRGGLGSWAYTAPEVIPDGRRASVQSDVYGLGRTALFILLAGTCDAEARRQLPLRWPSLQLSDVVPRLRCSTEVLKAVLAATSTDPAARPASVEAFIDALRLALDEEQHLLARRFKWTGGLTVDDLCQRHAAFDLHAAAGTAASVEVTTFSDAASRRIEALFRGRDWARLSLDLHHESIPAVRARGRDGRGRYWLAMAAEVSSSRGLADALASGSGVASGALVEWVGVVRHACAVVAYAHRRGVVHRDLRPDHVVVGAAGQVAVRGWGIAVPRMGEDREVHSEHVDISAAGWMLARVLVGDSAGRPVGFVADAAAPTAEVVAVRDGWTAAERELGAVAAGALAGAHESMEGLVGAIDCWLSRQAARRSLAEVQPLLDRSRRLRRLARAFDEAARRARDDVRPWDPERRKRRWWLAEDTARRLRREGAAVEQSWLAAATPLAAQVCEARAALLEYYRERLYEADEQGDSERVRLLEGIVAVQFGGDAAEAVTGTQIVVLDGRAVPSMVWLETLDLEGRRARVLRREVIGRGQRFELALAPGSYVAEYDCHGNVVRYPFLVTRRGVLPSVLRLPMPPRGALGDGDVLVAAGECQIGGDALAADGLPARTVFVDAFVMRRHPVTHREYLAFVNDLWRRGERSAALRMVPRRVGNATPEYRSDENGFSIEGCRLDGDGPVDNICGLHAQIFTRWYASAVGLAWSLPHEFEWEKAARGVDARFFPWGNGLDEGCANMGNSRQGAARPVGVRAYSSEFPDDISPYGVAGLGGNMRTWCRNPWRASGPRLIGVGERACLSPGDIVTGRESELTSVRGGAYAVMGQGCRSAGRFANAGTTPLTTTGIRLVRALTTDTFPGI